MSLVPFTLSEVGVLTVAVVPSLVVLGLVVYLVVLARRLVRAQEWIADALERGGGRDDALR